MTIPGFAVFTVMITRDLLRSISIFETLAFL